MALPSPDFPLIVNDGNEQDTSNDVPGDTTIANAADYNEHSAEIIAVQQFIRQTKKMVVWNATGGALSGGSVVYANGHNGTDNLVTIDLAQANASATPAIGIIESTINDASSGVIIQKGPTTANTTGRSIGDPVYLSTTAGAISFTTTEQRIGTVLTVAAPGIIYVDFSFAVIREIDQPIITTTDSTLTTVATIPLDDDSVYLVEAFVLARRTDASGRAAYHRRASIYRESGGAATLVGSVDTSFTREDPGNTNPWDATISVSGNNALIQVNGQNGHTVNWKSLYRLRSIS